MKAKLIFVLLTSLLSAAISTKVLAEEEVSQENDKNLPKPSDTTKPQESSQKAPEVKQETSPGIETDEATFKEIFESNVTRAKVEVMKETSSFRLTPTFSWATIDELTTSNNYFTVPASNSISSIPLIQAQFGWKAFAWKGIELLPTGSVGYGMKESVVKAYKKQVAQDFTDVLRIHWLPLSVGGQVSYKIPGLRVVKVFVNPSVGVQWLYQAGRLDGIDQGFWIPFYKLGGGVNLFDQSEDPSAWFGGVTLSAETLSSFGSSQTSKLWMLDLGLTLLL